MNEATEFSFALPYTSDRRSPARWVLSHARRQWPFLLGGIAGAVGNALMGAVVPVTIGKAVNAVAEHRADPALLLWFALLVAGSQAARMAFQFLRGASFEVVAQRAERFAREELTKSLLGKSMAVHSDQPIGEVLARATNDVREINYLFSPGINWVVGSMVFLLLPLWMAPRYDPQLVATPLLFLIGYGVVLWIYLKQLTPVTRDVRTCFGRLNACLGESLDGIEQVKGAAREQRELDRFATAAHAYRNAMVRQGDVEARFLPMLVLSVTLAVGLGHALLLYRAGRLEVGDVVAYFGLLMLLEFPTFSSIFAYSRVASGMAGARRILALMTRKTDLDENPEGYTGPMRGEIRFDNVGFAYGEGEPVLTDIQCHIRAGQRVALVGQTGSGKTTFTKLVNRTHDVSAGHVRIDGHDVRDWSLGALRGSIAVIEQDIFLFSKSVAENIAFGRPEATREEIENAARAAQAHDFIMAFPQGYDTVVGERGVTLSGGQRQRLALARALLTDPRILVLDDSTSAIDSATEDRIQRAIFKASEGRTTLLITHRLSQIRWADLVLVLRRGRLVAAGTHDELMRSCESYRRIFQ